MKFRFTLWVILCMLFCGCGLDRPAPKPDAAKTADNITIEGVSAGGLTPAELTTLLECLAQRTYQAPRNAFFSDNGRIEDERPGQRLNVEATKARVLAAPAGSALTGVYYYIPPDITRQQLEQSTVAGSHTSPILSADAGRLKNIRLTSALINNAVIGPGQEFSFNRLVGEPTEERGFEYAIVFDGGKQVMGMGGGMCQVSSTLYNAVLEARLPVTERHPHSMPVNYVPDGRDATTFTDKDLRFVNNTRHTLLIKSFVHDRKLTVEIRKVK